MHYKHNHFLLLKRKSLITLEAKDVVENGTFWVNLMCLLKPHEEYLLPNQLIEIAKDDHFDF